MLGRAVLDLALRPVAVAVAAPSAAWALAGGLVRVAVRGPEELRRTLDLLERAQGLLSVIEPPVRRAAAQVELLGDGVETAVGEGVAAQQAPAGENPAAERAVAVNGLIRVRGTGGLVAAAGGHQGGEQAAIAVDEQGKEPFHVERSALTSSRMLRLAPARHYLVSTNGDTFHHPDDVALARVVLKAPAEATLWFNYRTPRTERWDDPGLRERHGYRAAYPEGPAAGAVLELEPRS